MIVGIVFPMLTFTFRKKHTLCDKFYDSYIIFKFLEKKVLALRLLR